MTMVAVYNSDFASSNLAEGNFIIISPRHNRDFERLATSIYWCMLMRVIVPVFAAAVSWVGFTEGLRKLADVEPDTEAKRELRACSIYICFSEGASSCALGLMNALGQYGPMLLPKAYHDIFFTQLSSLFLFNSVLIAFMMEEFFNAFYSGQPLRRLSIKHGKRLLLLSIIPVIDLAFGVLRILGAGGISSGTMFFLVGFILVSLYVTVIYLSQARKLAKTLHVKVRRVESGGVVGPPGFLKVNRYITKCLVLNGSLLLLWDAMSVWLLAIGLREIPSIYEYSAFCFVATSTRVLMTFWHVSVVMLRDYVTPPLECTTDFN